MGLIERALSQYGIKEIPGVENNPEIMKYFKLMGQNWVQGDETAWCSAFVNWVGMKEDCEVSGKLNARSWLKCGYPVKNYKDADIVIFWRGSGPDDWRGHVGFPVNAVNHEVWTLGGNQNNMVKISPYPESRVLGYRKLYKK